MVMNEIYGMEKQGGERDLPEVSALTGRPLYGPCVTERIPDTPYFVQYEANRAHRITDAQRQAWRDGVPMNRFIAEEALDVPADEDDDHGS